MKANVGTIDKTVRIVIGLAIIGAGVFFQNWLGAIGAIFVATGFMNFCPMYAMIGMSSKKNK